MKRTNFYFPEQMLARLKAASEEQGIPVSEIIRRAVDAFLQGGKVAAQGIALTEAERSYLQSLADHLKDGGMIIEAKFLIDLADR